MCLGIRRSRLDCQSAAGVSGGGRCDRNTGVVRRHGGRDGPALVLAGLQHDPRAFGRKPELLYRFGFSERPGAPLRFLNGFGSRWNITMYHYRNHGAAWGRSPASRHDLKTVQASPPTSIASATVIGKRRATQRWTCFFARGSTRETAVHRVLGRRGGSVGLFGALLRVFNLDVPSISWLSRCLSTAGGVVFEQHVLERWVIPLYNATSFVGSLQPRS